MTEHGIGRRGCIVSRKKQRSESWLQEIIMAKYPDLVREAKERLCPRCAFLNSRECQNLCPITSEGEIALIFAKARPLARKPRVTIVRGPESTYKIAPLLYGKTGKKVLMDLGIMDIGLEAKKE